MLQVRFLIIATLLSCSPLAFAGQDHFTDCTVLSTIHRYVGKKLICTQRVKCVVASAPDDDEGSTKPAKFNCLPKADDNCADISWQDCLADTTIPNDFDYANCMSETPGPTPLGCKLNTSVGPITVADEAEVTSQVETAAKKIDFIQSKVTFKDAELTDKSLSVEERSEKLIVRARRMQLILQAIGCKPAVITPDNLYGVPKSDQASFLVGVENCVIKEKSADCGAKFESRNIPGVQLVGYKACQRSGSAGSKSGAVSAATKSNVAH